MNIKKIESKIFFLFFVFISFSCNLLESSKEKSKIDKLWLGKSIVIPSSVIKINPEALDKKSKYKIIVLYDGNCSMCYMELIKWKGILNDFKNSSVEIKFILTGMNLDIIKFYLKEVNFIDYNLFFDSKKDFQKKFKFMLGNEYKYASVLLNSDNEIISIKNPTLSKKNKDDLIKLINI